jgi:GxxExxY protein
MQHSEKSEKIIKAFYTVYNTLGYGFFEKVYENALMIELRKLGFSLHQQKQLMVYYESEIVGEYYCDILVDDCIILEIKSADTLSLDHEKQIVNYLKATAIEVGLLLNFGHKAEFQRKIFSNDRKSVKLGIPETRENKEQEMRKRNEREDE